MPRGQRRSTSTRYPSPRAGFSYARFSKISILLSAFGSCHRAGILDVLLDYVVDIEVCQRADRIGGIVRGVLRKRAGTEDEEIVHVPALLVLVEHAGLRVASHRRATRVVRALVDRAVVVPGARTSGGYLRAKRRADFLQHLRHVFGLVELVGSPVKG